MKSDFCLLVMFSVFLTACSTLAPEPTATPTATATNTPQPTATLTNTPEPQTNDFDLPDAPLTEWRGIPIMPEAIAGGILYSGYIFSVDVPPEEVIAFYDRELGALGYINFPPSVDFTKTILGIYHNNNVESIIEISALMQDDGSLIVLIVN